MAGARPAALKENINWFCLSFLPSVVVSSIGLLHFVCHPLNCCIHITAGATPAVLKENVNWFYLSFLPSVVVNSIGLLHFVCHPLQNTTTKNTMCWIPEAIQVNVLDDCAFLSH